MRYTILLGVDKEILFHEEGVGIVDPNPVLEKLFNGELKITKTEHITDRGDVRYHDVTYYAIGM
jgi:hypothetical protein